MRGWLTRSLPPTFATRNLVHPNWLLVVTSGPLLLALLGYGEFSVIRSLLPPASLGLWQAYAWGLAGLGLASLADVG